MPPANSTSSSAKQDCSRCRMMNTCWSSRHSDWEVQARLLVCRIHIGIRPKVSRESLARLLAPEVDRAVRTVPAANNFGHLGIDVEDLVQEALLEAVRFLCEDFIIGESWVLYVRLFDPRGVVPTWVRAHCRMLQRRPRDVYMEDIEGFDVACVADSEKGVLSDEVVALADHSGLTETEWKAVQHLLADETPRELRNARSSGARKLATLLGYDEDLVPVPGNPRRRRAWAEGQTVWPLTRREQRDIVCALADGIAVGDLSWAYGVSREAIRGCAHQ